MIHFSTYKVLYTFSKISCKFKITVFKKKLKMGLFSLGQFTSPSGSNYKTTHSQK